MQRDIRIFNGISLCEIKFGAVYNAIMHEYVMNVLMESQILGLSCQIEFLLHIENMSSHLT